MLLRMKKKIDVDFLLVHDMGSVAALQQTMMIRRSKVVGVDSKIPP